MCDVIVAGYPKSGCTWVTRLTAELIGCPVAGIWGKPNDWELAVEGTKRVSPHRCYKTHHSFHELATATEKQHSAKVIYVIRDPRDVVISGSHAISFNWHTRIPIPAGMYKIMEFVWTYIEVLARRKLSPPCLVRQQQRLAYMMQALIEGDKHTPSLRVPWKEHVSGYLQAGILVVRYEDMLTNPEKECERILAHFGCECQTAEIRKAIELHEFNRKKERFLREGNSVRARHMRRGQAGEGRTAMSADQQALISHHCGELMRQFNYE